MENRKRFLGNKMSVSRTKGSSRLKVQEICTEFKINGSPIKISVQRYNNYKSNFTIEQDKKVIKEGSIRRVNLSNCLLEIVRENKYLQYCNPVMAWSTYEFDKAFVDIRLHPSGDGSWEVRIRFNNGESQFKNFPITMSQGDVMNSLILELGLPNRNETNKNNI